MPPPPKPTLVFANGIHVDTIKVSWRPHISVTEYRVRYQNHDDAVWITTRQTETSIEITGRWDCKDYYNFEIYAWGDGIRFAERWGLPIKAEYLNSICPPAWGHQADHTVRWQKGAYPPPPEESEKYHDDALAVWNSAIPAGARTWSGEAGIISLCSTSCAANADEQVYTVQKGGPGACGRGFACVYPATLPSDGHRFPHLASSTITFELIGIDKDGYNVVWTTNQDLHEEDAPGHMNRYYYMNAIAAHEFGHTLGINDLGTRPFFWNSVMADPHSHFTPTHTDEKIVRAIYLGHQSHALD